MKKLQAVNVRDLTPKMSRMLRARWGLDIPTVAGRADLGMQAVGQFERGRLPNVKLIFRINLAKALRQLAFERAQEAVRVYGEAIQADADAAEYTKEGAVRRRIMYRGR